MPRGSGNPTNYEAGGDCTTSPRKTHNTVALLVYPWHPWHGKKVEIREKFVRRGCSVLHCTLDGANSAKAFEIPAWMFSRSVCWAQDLSKAPFVSVQALRDLRELLSRASTSVDIQYSSFVPQGDTDATEPIDTKSTPALSSAGEDSQVGGLYARRQEESPLPTGMDASAASRSDRRGEQR